MKMLLHAISLCQAEILLDPRDSTICVLRLHYLLAAAEMARIFDHAMKKRQSIVETMGSKWHELNKVAAERDMSRPPSPVYEGMPEGESLTSFAAPSGSELAFNSMVWVEEDLEEVTLDNRISEAVSQSSLSDNTPNRHSILEPPEIPKPKPSEKKPPKWQPPLRAVEKEPNVSTFADLRARLRPAPKVEKKPIVAPAPPIIPDEPTEDVDAAGPRPRRRSSFAFKEVVNAIMDQQVEASFGLYISFCDVCVRLLHLHLNSACESVARTARHIS